MKRDHANKSAHGGHLFQQNRKHLTSPYFRGVFLLNMGFSIECSVRQVPLLITTQKKAEVPLLI